MKKYISLLAFVSLLAVGFTSCDDDDDFTPQAIGDVYNKTIKVGDEIRHFLVSTAYTNYYIGSVKVGTPVTGADSIVLTKYENSPNIFRNAPESEDDYSTEIPAKGEYGFRIKSTDGDVVTKVDTYGGDTLAVADLSLTKFESNNVALKFEPIENAHAYQVKMFYDDDKLVYVSNFFESESNIVEEDVEGEDGETVKVKYKRINIDKYILGNQANNIDFSKIKSVRLIAIKFEGFPYNDMATECISEASVIRTTEQ